MLDKAFQPQPIAVGPEARDHTHGEIGQQRSPPFRLAREDIGEMDFHEWHLHREQRIAHCQTGVCERRRVDHRASGTPLQSLDRLHELAFMIGLNPCADNAKGAGVLLGGALDVGETGATVNLGLALAQEIQVRAVQHGDYDLSFLSHCWN